VATLLLVRHGETAWNAERRWQGHADPPLNDVGRAQARELADQLADEPLTAVYSSDLVRAHETARIVAERHGLDVVVDRDLREIDVGAWSGLTHDEIRLRFPQDLERWQTTGVAAERGGETTEQLHERVVAAAERIARGHEGEQILIVSHGGALRTLALHAQAIEDDYRLGNCHVVRVRYEGGGFRGVD
jgi:broad specificity phosphatase PhoE